MKTRSSNVGSLALGSPAADLVATLLGHRVDLLDDRRRERVLGRTVWRARIVPATLSGCRRSVISTSAPWRRRSCTAAFAEATRVTFSGSMWVKPGERRQGTDVSDRRCRELLGAGVAAEALDRPGHVDHRLRTRSRRAPRRRCRRSAIVPAWAMNALKSPTSPPTTIVATLRGDAGAGRGVAVDHDRAPVSRRAGPLARVPVDTDRCRSSGSRRHPSRRTRRSRCAGHHTGRRCSGRQSPVERMSRRFIKPTAMLCRPLGLTIARRIRVRSRSSC